MKRISIAIAGLLSFAALTSPAGAQSPEPATTLVSDGNGWSGGCDVSRGGRAVAFWSAASNLVRRDTNDQYDVFLASGGGIERVSVTSREKQGVALTSAPSISDDGTRVAFSARGYRLVEEGRIRHHFVRDISRGLTERVTSAADGGRPDGGSTGIPQISGDGRYVAFHSHAKDLTEKLERDDNADVFVRTLARDDTDRVGFALDGGRPNRWSGEPAPSLDARFVAFVSMASNLVRDDDNAAIDVFRYDTRARRTIRVSIATDGTESTHHSFRPVLSGDGRFVAFESYSRLVPEDTNDHLDVYVHDASAGTTELISTGAAGAGNASSQDASISADGRYVAFTSQASNLVVGDTNTAPPLSQGFDVFVRDRAEGETTLESVGDEGQRGDRDSGGGEISPDGNWVCWESESSTLVPGDDNGVGDVFLRGPLWAGEE